MNLVIGFLLVAFSSSVCYGAERPPSLGAKEDQALEAVKSWFAFVDQGRYAESWEKVSPILIESIDQREWEEGFRQRQAIAGRVIEREVISYQYLDPKR